MLDNNVAMILMATTSPPMDKQDQLIITFHPMIIYSINHQIIFHSKLVVLIHQIIVLVETTIN